MSKKAVFSFRARKFEDFEILDGSGDVFGHIRIKPSSLLWCPKGGQKWYGLRIAEFAQLAKARGKPQEK